MDYTFTGLRLSPRGRRGFLALTSVASLRSASLSGSLFFAGLHLLAFLEEVSLAVLLENVHVCLSILELGECAALLGNCIFQYFERDRDFSTELGEMRVRGSLPSSLSREIVRASFSACETRCLFREDLRSCGLCIRDICFCARHCCLFCLSFGDGFRERFFCSIGQALAMLEHACARVLLLASHSPRFYTRARFSGMLRP